MNIFRLQRLYCSSGYSVTMLLGLIVIDALIGVNQISAASN